MKPQFKSLVLVSKNARITRPKKEVAGLNDILKVDQIKTRIDRAMDTDTSVLAIAKLIGSDTLEEFAATLAAQHKPITFDWHARFGLPKDAPAPSLPAHSEDHPHGAEPKKAKLALDTLESSLTYEYDARVRLTAAVKTLELAGVATLARARQAERTLPSGDPDED